MKTISIHNSVIARNSHYYLNVTYLKIYQPDSEKPLTVYGSENIELPEKIPTCSIFRASLGMFTA